VNPFAGGGLFRLFSTHPPLEQRVQNLVEIAQRLGQRVA
jgi:heat shock protein HtpX